MLKTIQLLCDVNRRGFSFCLGGFRLAPTHPMEDPTDAVGIYRIEKMRIGCAVTADSDSTTWVESLKDAARAHPLPWWPTTFPRTSPAPWFRYGRLS